MVMFFNPEEVAKRCGPDAGARAREARAARKRPIRAPRRWTLSRRRQVSWLAGRCGGPSSRGEPQ